MNIKEAINRGFNLLSISIASLAGLAFMPEIFLEKDRIDKLDDALLLIIAIFGMWWYNKSNNKYVRSALPMVLVLIGLGVKLGGLLIELDDPEAFGDDIGGLILFVLAAVLVVKQYKTTGKLFETN